MSMGVGDRRKRRDRFSTWVVSVLFMVSLSVLGCAAGIPSIPNSPNAIIAKADDHYQRGKYFQSQELYKAFLQRHPGHERSDYAQFMLAESYFSNDEFGLAAVEYRLLIGNYGYSDYVDDGYFKEALSFYEQSPKAVLDQSKCYDALSRLRTFEQVFPTSSLLPEALKYIGIIKRKLANKEFENAMFYYRQKRYKSARIYLDKIIRDYDDNEFWVRALFYKAKILQSNGDKEEALRLYERVLEYPSEIDVKAEAETAVRQIEQN